MMHRWRSLPDDVPRLTMPVLWCLVAVAAAAIVIASIDSSRNPVPAQQSSFWAVLASAGVPILGFSMWGLIIRRFAFGSAWIAATLLAAGILCGGLLYYVEESVRSSTSDGAGFAGIVAFFGAIGLFFGLIVASSILYAVYWRRKYRSILRPAPGKGPRNE
jgi:hypothetical protein